MKTFFLLMAQYDSSVVIPVKTVCQDYFTHLSPEIFLRRVSSGEINIPLMRMDKSQKSAKGIHLQDLAEYLDKVRFFAKKEADQLHS